MKPTQHSLAISGLEAYRKSMRRDEFLQQMNQLVPWPRLCALNEPVHSKNEGSGRPVAGLERMLRIYFSQQWFNLSDPAVELSLCDNFSMRQFVGIDLGIEGAPDETTVCKFRQLLGEAQTVHREYHDPIPVSLPPACTRGCTSIALFNTSLYIIALNKVSTELEAGHRSLH